MSDNSVVIPNEGAGELGWPSMACSRRGFPEEVWIAFLGPTIDGHRLRAAIPVVKLNTSRDPRCEAADGILQLAKWTRRRYDEIVLARPAEGGT